MQTDNIERNTMQNFSTNSSMMIKPSRYEIESRKYSLIKILGGPILIRLNFLALLFNFTISIIISLNKMVLLNKVKKSTSEFEIEFEKKNKCKFEVPDKKDPLAKIYKSSLECNQIDDVNIALNKQQNYINKDLENLKLISSSSKFLGWTGFIFGIINTMEKNRSLGIEGVRITNPCFINALLILNSGFIISLCSNIYYKRLENKCQKYIKRITFFSKKFLKKCGDNAKSGYPFKNGSCNNCENSFHKVKELERIIQNIGRRRGVPCGKSGFCSDCISDYEDDYEY